MNEAIKTRTPNDWFLEWGGGYFYPDLFGMDVCNRWELLASEMDRIWQKMKDTGTEIVAFNMTQADSPDALKAYQVMAGETDGLLAIFVFQYSPYEGGGGKIFWVKDKRGIEIPVITCRYSLWFHKAKAKLAGTPAKVARLIKDTVATTPAGQLPATIGSSATPGPFSRTRPALTKKRRTSILPLARPGAACAAMCPRPGRPSDCLMISGSSAAELAWRIRMQHNPEQTRQVLHARSSLMREKGAGI